MKGRKLIYEEKKKKREDEDEEKRRKDKADNGTAARVCIARQWGRLGEPARKNPAANQRARGVTRGNGWYRILQNGTALSLTSRFRERIVLVSWTPE